MAGQIDDKKKLPSKEIDVKTNHGLSLELVITLEAGFITTGVEFPPYPSVEQFENVAVYKENRLQFVQPMDVYVSSTIQGSTAQILPKIV